MQKLGIMDLSHNVNSLLPPKRSRKNPLSTPCSSPLPPPGPLRRSSRLKNTVPVGYSEVGVAKKDEGVKLRDGTRPEVYTEEHEKLLGNAEGSWTFFEDGCGEDGNRIFDPIKGKTCHQCRQKTLGHRSCCSKCNMVQGQLGGDCLYLRYGEHVFEAIENPNWVCPVCRGICNCSLRRNTKGWPPAGALYKKISQLGFKSVAHHLFETKQAQTNIDEKNPENGDPVSTRRSLSFLDTEAQLKESYKNDDSNHLEVPRSQSEESNHNGFNCEKDKKIHTEPNPAAIHQISVKKSNFEHEFKDGESAEDEVKANGYLGFPELDLEGKQSDGFKGEYEKESNILYKEHDSGNMALEPRSDGNYDFHSDEVTGMAEEPLDAKQAVNNTFCRKMNWKKRRKYFLQITNMVKAKY